FVEHARTFVARTFPTLHDNPDYTSIVSDRHYRRLIGLLDDARARGASVVGLEPAGEPHTDARTRKLAPTLVLNPQEDMQVMQEE
ncbi:aldehyde dehydrogenase family protein, partial [Salmonella enterica subsp. enterica]